MQEVKREDVLLKACDLLKSGVVNRVLGWRAGEFDYDVMPAIFDCREDILENFVWNDFCYVNLSKYLIKETEKNDGKILVFLKPCDSYSFNQLLSENRFSREKVYVVGVSCDGMLDVSKIKNKTGSILHIKEDDDKITIQTIFDKNFVFKRDELLPDRCINCKSKKHAVYDELLGTERNISDCRRFDEVKKIENMTSKERFLFWQGELSRCIRCNACRNVCPACTCENCVFDNPNSGIENKSPSNSFEEKMFHIIRAFHVAGRCTDCGECSRVCPQNIPLHLINRKFIKDINSFYKDYQAGAEIEVCSPLMEFSTQDIEPKDAIEKGKENV